MSVDTVASVDDAIDISDVIAVVNAGEVEEASRRVDRLLTDQTVMRRPMNMVAFD